jgi:hypothetical protein
MSDAYTWECRNCENSNPLKLLKCKHCKVGERPSAQAVKDGIQRTRGLCHFVSYKTGKQCPLAGAVAEEIGKDRPEWCSGHKKHKDGPEGERVYEENCHNYDQIMASARNSFHNDPVGWVMRNRPELITGKKAEAAKESQQDIEERKRQAAELVDRLQADAPPGMQHVSEIIEEEYGQYIQEEEQHG